jgi:prevent-host-death family protein
MRQIGAYEAKTHLPRLLDDVANGESITITKRGVPVALLVPALTRSQLSVRDAVSGLRAFRVTHRLDGLTIRDLIDEGRR